MEILGTSKVHNKGKVTIPSTVRDKLKINDGDIVYFYADSNGRIVIAKSEPVFF
jgi:AbrB family looped-hinge helix DNA binding protein